MLVRAKAAANPRLRSLLIAVPLIETSIIPNGRFRTDVTVDHIFPQHGPVAFPGGPKPPEPGTSIVSSEPDGAMKAPLDVTGRFVPSGEVSQQARRTA